MTAGVTSLGEQPHDSPGCRWAGRPHLGPCWDRSREAGRSLTEVRTVLSRARTALAALERGPMEYHRLPKPAPVPGSADMGEPPEDYRRPRFNDPDLDHMRAALGITVAVLTPWDRDGRTRQWVADEPASGISLDGPAGVYGFDRCDEMTLGVLGTLAKVRRRLAASGNLPAVDLVDSVAREVVAWEREDEDCDDGWHTQRGEPADECPTCGDKPAPFDASTAVPGTVVVLGSLVVRRRPAATGGLPWKSKVGTRYDHNEVQALVGGGAQVTFCAACAEHGSCREHDDYAGGDR